MSDLPTEGCFGCLFTAIVIVFCIGMCIAGIENQWKVPQERPDARARESIPGPVRLGTELQVKTENLHVRSGPGGNYSVLATIPKGTKVVTYAETKMMNGAPWSQVYTLDRNISGWVNLNYLSP